MQFPPDLSDEAIVPTPDGGTIRVNSDTMLILNVFDANVIDSPARTFHIMPLVDVGIKHP
jgi:hypothetical protein